MSKVIKYTCNPCGYDYAVSFELEDGQTLFYSGIEFKRGQHVSSSHVVGLNFAEALAFFNSRVKEFH